MRKKILLLLLLFQTLGLKCNLILYWYLKIGENILTFFEFCKLVFDNEKYSCKLPNESAKYTHVFNQ